MKYPYYKRAQVVFCATARGELAAVRDPQTRKWGLIDRSAAWVVQPFSASMLEWDEDRSCFADEEGNPVVL